MNRKLFTSGLFIVVGLLLGRITGFGREFFMAYKLGTSEFADVAVILLTLPDYLVAVLTAGGLSYALLPEFKRLPQLRAEALYAQSCLLIGLIYGVVTICLIFAASHLVYLLAPGITEIMHLKATELIKLSLWVIPLSALTGITTAYLQSSERFMVTSLATPLFNTMVLLGLIYVGQSYEELRYLTYFILGAALLRWLSQLFRVPFRSYRLQNFFTWEITTPLLKNYFLITLSSLSIIIFPQLLRLFGSFTGTGSLAKLSYALKISEIPLGIFLTSLSILLFPKFAEHFKRDEKTVSQEGMLLLRNAIKLIAITGLASVMVMIVFAEDLSKWAYGWGNISEATLLELGFYIAIALIGILPQGLSSLLICVYTAKADAKPLLYINIAGSILLGAGCFCVKSFGLSSIIFIYVVNNYFICAAQLYYLVRRHHIVVVHKPMIRELVISLGAMLTLLLPLAWSASFYELASLGRFLHVLFFSPLVLTAGLIAVTDFRKYALNQVKRREQR